MTHMRTAIGDRVYDLGDKHSLASNFAPGKLKALKYGGFRRPKKGEWFLSGDNPLAYKAHKDLIHEYHIAVVVYVEEIGYLLIKKVLDN